MLNKNVLRPILQIIACAVMAACGIQLADLAHAQTTRPAAPATQSAARTPDNPDDLSFLQLLTKGGWFMVPIGVASMIGMALILERAVALRRGKIVPRRFMRDLKRIAPEGAENRETALRYCRDNPSPISRVVAAGLRKLPQGQAAVERAIEDTGANEVQKLRRNMRMMYGVSVVTPMLGLLGTVWGMISAFRVTSSAQGLGKPELLARGIYEALVCTLAALMVAIPILMIYYYFVAKIERHVAELNERSLEFTDHFLDRPRRAATLETVLKSEI
jgi:biopolymer transport protein ExbB